MTLIECVPNFSEGRDASVIASLLEAAASIPGASLLDHTSDFDHNRTVLTIAGEPAAVAKCVRQTVAVAARRIDLSRHSGVHPRIGVADVIPFIPLSGASLENCVEIAHAVGRELWNDLGIPVFFYEAAASNPSRKRLETFRSRSFQGTPDIGEGRHPTAGASVVGARDFLVAWNIWLDSRDLAGAREVARQVRQSSGGLPFTKALGLELPSRKLVQVSINLTDFTQTPLHIVYNRVCQEAESRGLAVLGSELIGLLPQKALDLSAGHDLHWMMERPIKEYTVEWRLAALP